MLKCVRKINNVFSDIKNEKYYRYNDPNRKVTYVLPSQNLTYTPYKMYWYKARGIRGALAGSSPIYILLLKNNQNEIIEVALISLGINNADEFLKAVNGNDEYILNYEFFEKIGFFENVLRIEKNAWHLL